MRVEGEFVLVLELFLRDGSILRVYKPKKAKRR